MIGSREFGDPGGLEGPAAEIHRRVEAGEKVGDIVAKSPELADGLDDYLRYRERLAEISGSVESPKETGHEVASVVKDLGSEKSD